MRNPSRPRQGRGWNPGGVAQTKASPAAAQPSSAAAPRPEHAAASATARPRKSPPVPRLPGPGGPRGLAALAWVEFRSPAVINSSVFVNKRRGHSPRARLIVPSLPPSLRAGAEGCQAEEVGASGLRVTKCKHFLSSGRASTSDSGGKKNLKTKNSKLGLQNAQATATPRSRDS